MKMIRPALVECSCLNVSSYLHGREVGHAADPKEMPPTAMHTTHTIYRVRRPGGCLRLVALSGENGLC